MNEILRYLPRRVISELGRIEESDAADEIRLRIGGPVSVTVNGENRVLGICCTRAEITETVMRLCGGSVHAHGESIRRGYISLPDGCRAGICGTALAGNGTVMSVHSISSVNIRISRRIENISGPLCGYLRNNGYQNGVLVYAPPGEGKTTLLRDAASSLSRPPHNLRVSVIDTRGELYREDMFCDSIADIYTGYPKPEGIEAAIRTMTPQIIVCDEIGTVREAESILSFQHSGVPLLASAHGDNIRSLLMRPGISMLHENGVFGCYMGIRRRHGGFLFNITRREEI